MNKYFLVETPSIFKDLKGKSGKIYNFYAYNIDSKLTKIAENESSIYYIAKVNQGKIEEIIHFGKCCPVISVLNNENINKLISTDIENHLLFIYNETPHNIDEVFKDIQDNYNFDVKF